MTYAPTARVAQHLSSHSVYPENAPSVYDMYPQYAQAFEKMDNPKSFQDWQIRHDAEVKVCSAVKKSGSISYGYQLSQLPSTLLTNSYQQAPPTPVSNPQLPYAQPQAIAYNYLSSYLPHTPNSLGGATRLGTFDSDFERQAAKDRFEEFVDSTLSNSIPQKQLHTPEVIVPSQHHMSFRAQQQVKAPNQPLFPLTPQKPLTDREQQSQSQPPSHPASYPLARSSLFSFSTDVSQNRPYSTPLRMAQGGSPQKRNLASIMAMRSPNPSTSAVSTPTHNSVVTSPFPPSSPDSMNFSGSSPSKRPRASKDISPTWASSKTTSEEIELGRLNMGEQSINASPSKVTHEKSKIILRIPLRPPLPAVSQQTSDTLSAQSEDEEEENELGWSDVEKKDTNGDVRMELSSPAPGYTSMQMSMSGRTGGRDMRSLWQKLQSLIKDIFEELDSLPIGASSGPLDSVNAKFFSSASKDDPLLSCEIMSKLVRYVIRIQAIQKKRKPNGKDEGDWDLDIISRLLKLLERRMKATKDLIVFPEDRKAVIIIEEKSRRGKRGSGSSPPIEDSKEKLPVGVGMCEVNLAKMKGGAAAAECCLTLLDSMGLSKQVYSEDMLSTCVQMIKEQFVQIIMPVLHGLAGEKISSSYLTFIIQHEYALRNGKTKLSITHSPYFYHPVISSIAQSVCSALPHLTSLVSCEKFSFSESLVIQNVFLAKEPLFITEIAGKKQNDRENMAIVKKLRLEALALLRGVFSRYESHRQWIIEEVLSSLVGKLGQSHDQAMYQLANGKSIHAVSALLLQLIQASASGTSVKIRNIYSFAANMESLEAVEKEKENFLEEETRMCAETIEASLRSATLVAGYILSKATSTKTTKTSIDTDYKTILTLFINDLLAVLYRPEWPAASLYLSVLTKIMINSLDESKTGTDAIAAKNIALEYLADIAATLKGLGIEMLKGTRVSTLDEVVSLADLDGLKRLLSSHLCVRTFLNTAARDDRSFGCSLEMTSIIWAQELQSGIKKTAAVIENLSQETNDEARETAKRLRNILEMLKNTLREIWLADDRIFEVNDPQQSEQAVQASIAVSRGRSLQNASDPILHALLTTLGTSSIGLRIKALRGVSSIIMVDPELLQLHYIRAALEERLSDVSPGVRDAAVELIGKYLVQKPELASQYYPQIALRTMDTGLSVRKRVIKILKGIFANMEEKKMQVDICCRLIALIDDQDPGIIDLSAKTLTELIFSEGGNTASLLVEIMDDYRGSQAVLEKATNEVFQECKNIGQKARFGKIINDLVSHLIDATEQTEFDTLNHVRAIWLLVTSDPTQIDPQKASILLTYLRPPTNLEDQTVNELLLRIFQKTIPRMPRTASMFAQDLTKALLPMITRPAGGFQSLREVIGCLCVVTNNLTKDWMRVLSVLKACVARIKPLWQHMRTAKGQSTALNPAIAMTLYITALIVEGCNMDEIAKDDTSVGIELQKLSTQPIHEYLYEIYLDFTHVSSAHSTPTLCLGALFRSYPILMSRPETTSWMKTIFDSGDQDSQARLLGIINEFLISEAKKRAEGAIVKKDVNLLIGSARELQDSDHSTTIVQNNIAEIFNCAKSQHGPTQNSALDILTFVVNQGLFSPVHTVPILVSLETAEDPVVAERALALHQALHIKHASMIHVLFMDSAKASHAYQRGITAEPTGHRNGVALFSSWYGLLTEKRAWRHDFLKTLCRAFDSDLESKIDVDFVLYVAENLATLDYKLQEEPMTVVQALTRVVSTCSHMATIMEETSIEGENLSVLGEIQVCLGKISGETVAAARLADASIVVGLALLVKNHLIKLYHLPEDKCASHVPGKKSVIGEKPTQRRGMPVLDLNRMPLVRGVTTVGEFKEQQAAFLNLLQEDGTLSGEEQM
ncbi:hypothetical protein L204_102774 [Cryptococcus depauperatus]